MYARCRLLFIDRKNCDIISLSIFTVEDKLI
nr:MAG TPA: hypothetical protein [Caudoviricetes sp.]